MNMARICGGDGALETDSLAGEIGEAGDAALRHAHQFDDAGIAVGGDADDVGPVVDAGEGVGRAADARELGRAGADQLDVVAARLHGQVDAERVEEALLLGGEDIENAGRRGIAERGEEGYGPGCLVQRAALVADGLVLSESRCRSEAQDQQ
jgi:hypothetical protein